LNAACVVIETLNFILDRKNDRIVDIGTLAYDTVFFEASERNPNLLDSELENDLELHKEMEWQLRTTKNVA